MARHKVFFIEEKIRLKYEHLASGNDADRRLYRHITRAIRELSENPFIGIRMQKSIMPAEYRRYGVEKLLKYDLPQGWRLIYTLANEDIEIYAVIIEWFDHKNYEKRFGYII